jgi:leucyl aminopeptidase (aminopeptidase T)
MRNDVVVNVKKFSQRINLRIFENIIKNCLNIRNEKLLIVGDKGVGNNLVSPILTNAYSLAAKSLGIKYEVVYQNTKIRGENADLEPLGLSFRKFCKQRGHRFISSSSLGSITNRHLPTVLETLDIDYKAIERRSHRLKKILDNAKEIHIMTKAGTDLIYNVEGMEARIATGLYREPGTGGNLPASEVYIPPSKKRVHGSIVIDGSARIKDKTILVKNPIRLEVSNGEIVWMNNTNEAKQLKKTLEWAHMRSEHPWGVRRIGELGIGLNEKAKIIGATIIDEKALGTCHFAIGSNAWFGGDVYSIIHLDQVIRDPVIKVDGRIIKV